MEESVNEILKQIIRINRRNSIDLLSERIVLLLLVLDFSRKCEHLSLQMKAKLNQNIQIKIHFT